jgi:predicted HNH restriction endonuclease
MDSFGGRRALVIDEGQFGTATEYVRAFEAILAERVPDQHRAMLRAHMAAPGYAVTWAGLAAAVGYSAGHTVNLQYGKLAERVARQLGMVEKPATPGGQTWWLWALVRWGPRDPESGHTVFVLRSPVVEALSRLGFGPIVPPNQPAVEVSAAEGRELLRLHRTRERSRGLVARKKRAVLAAAGRLECEACGFDFAAAYGPRGDGFAECHHTHPISESAPGRRTRLSELAVVCANCHRMLHRRPWASVPELRAIVQSRRGG